MRAVRAGLASPAGLSMAVVALALTARSRSFAPVTAETTDACGRTATPTAGAAVVLGPCDRTR